MSDRTTITIKKNQHETLESIKNHLKQKATDELNLSQTGYKPSHVDALQYLIDKARDAELQQQESEDGSLPEDHPWHPSNQD